MAEKKTAAAAHDVVVIFRTGYGQDWKDLYHMNRDEYQKKGLTLDEAKAAAIDEIRKHRGGAQGYEYRVKDMVSGALLD
jgi:hypothetical protein